MSEQYKRELLRIACAQICQTIGYNATTTSSLEILQDLLQRFILEFSKNLRQHVELCNRTTPTLDDVALTLSSLNINVNELQDYVGNVEPVAFAFDVPKFPAAKPINLNFLKPGSKEVLTRPVHVFEHLPPMLPSEENYAISANKAEVSKNQTQNLDASALRANNESEQDTASFPASNILATLAPGSKMHDERATREISSVVMTTGGFISPAIEGKLPEAGLPSIIDKLLGLDTPPPPTPPPPPPDMNVAVTQKSTEILERNTKIHTEIKDSKKPANNESVQPVPYIKKNFKSHLSDGPQSLKHLKKTKKKNSSAGLVTVANMSSLNLEEILNLNVEKLNEKGRRKRLKLLQKLIKNAQNHQDFEGTKGLSLSSYVAKLPPGLERLTLEKLLKKQAKQMQKLLKKRKQNPTETMLLKPMQRTTEQQVSEMNKKTLNEAENTFKVIEPLGPQQLNYEMKQTLNVVESISTDPSVDMRRTTDTLTENVVKPIDLKLSNEPDRTKLNIFKKISKAQKTPHIASGQAAPIPLMPLGLFTGSEGEIINLPTGTTITPAPLALNAPMGQETGNILQAPQNVMGTLPKKRGRKPGSKNQPKPQNLQIGALGSTSSVAISKKEKKVKLSKKLFTPDNINAFSVDKQLSLGVLDQPLSKNPPQIISPVTLPASLKPISRKERKEKTEKIQLIPDAFEQLQECPKPVFDHSSTDVKSESFGVGSVHIKPIDLLLKESSQEHVFNSKPKKRSPHQSQKKLGQAQTNVLGAYPPPAFASMPQNMLPLFPFSFPPRPGLIPAPGLFAPGAPGLTGFPSQPTALSGPTVGSVTNPALMGLGSPFFPYVAPNTTPTQNLKEKVRDPPASTNEHRNYCNVAPLVPPDTIKLVGSSSSKTLKQKCDSANSHTSPTNISRNSIVEETHMAKLAQTGNIGDPIEVSDDSDETTTPFNIKPFDKAGSSDSLPKLPTNTLYLSPTLPTLPPSPLTSKKHKKPQKVAGFPHPDSDIDVFPLGGESAHGPNFDGGFGKLAGGADLIPLSNNVSGSAYSAKSIPATSLTASSRQISPPSLVSQSVFENNKTSNPPSAIFNDVTITPTTPSASSEIPLKKKNKERKKLRKLKDGVEGKIKKKKDKKEKSREKERTNLLLSQCGENWPSDSHKESLKKLKKEKKKEKQRSKELIKANPNQNLDYNQHPKQPPEVANSFLSQLNDIVTTSSTAIINASSASPTPLPKLTLKIGASCPSPAFTSISKVCDEEQSKVNQKVLTEREPSPELARFSPLVTRPPKQKMQPQSENISVDVPSEIKTSEGKILNSLQYQPHEQQQQILLPPPSPWLSGSTLTASSVLLPQQLISSAALSVPSPKLKLKAEQPQRHALLKNVVESNIPASSGAATGSNDPIPLIKETNRPSSYVDAEGNTVWICPACGKVDDGSPMIGCDGCDAWYHWECVGIAVAPKDNEDWFCRVCITRKKGFHGSNESMDKKRKKNKKK